MSKHQPHNKNKWNTDTLKNRIISLSRNNHLSQAMELCLQLCRIAKKDPETFVLLGSLQSRSGLQADAVKSLHRAIRLRPGNYNAYYQIGILLGNCGDPKGAEKALRQAIRIKSDFSLASIALANTLHTTAKTADAITVLRSALNFDRGNYQLLLALANLLAATNQVQSAIELLGSAIQMNPQRIEAYVNRGTLEKSLGNYNAAIDSIQRALDIDPDNAEVNFNLGNVYREKGDIKQAATYYKNALASNPAMSAAYNNLGLMFYGHGLFLEALSEFQSALKNTPNYTDAAINMANTLSALGRFDDATNSLKQQLCKDPSNEKVHWNLALLLLYAGDFNRGWQEYEWRWHGGEGLIRAGHPYPAWKGEPLIDKTILVYAEQGIGDEIMFASCYADLIGLAKQTIILCDPRLVTIFEASFPHAIIKGQQQTISADQIEGLPEIDLQVAAGSLPQYLRTDIDSFPKHSGYLKASTELLKKWRARLDEHGNSLKVGISWRGGKTKQTIKERTADLTKWQPILASPGVQFVNLQYGDCTTELQTVETQMNINILQTPDIDPLAELDNYSALIGSLDLVISVDNSAVHLAGALGVPVWIMQPFIPNWRWQHNSITSYWYPSALQYHQSMPGEWDEVIQKVAMALNPLKS